MHNKKYSPWMNLAVRLIPALIIETAVVMEVAMAAMILGAI